MIFNLEPSPGSFLTAKNTGALIFRAEIVIQNDLNGFEPGSAHGEPRTRKNIGISDDLQTFDQPHEGCHDTV